MFPQTQEPINSGFTRTQLELVTSLRRLWLEHVYWTRLFLISKAFDLPDLPFVTQRLLQNPHDFANALRPLFGKQIAKQFEDLLTEHLVIASKIVDAAKAGDTAELDKQRDLWYANAESIAKFLASNNQFWNERVWNDFMFNHLQMTEDEIMQILNGQYEQSIKEFDSIQAEALLMADAMTRGIIRLFYLQ